MIDLEKITAQIEAFKSELPPVHNWQPERDAHMDLQILRDGRWIHEGGEIKRQSLIKLLASVMRRELDGRYALVTPQERVYIEVQDVPFLIVDWDFAESDQALQTLTLESNLGEFVVINEQQSLWLEPEIDAPYVMVRKGLAGRFNRAAYYRLAEVLEQRDGKWGVESEGYFNVLSS